MINDELAVLALAYGITGLTPAKIRAALDNADDALSALKDALSGIGATAPGEVETELAAAEKRAAKWESLDMQVLTCLSSNYPVQLLDVYDYPPVIFTQGTLPAFGKESGFAVVGSRAASLQELAQARDIAFAVVQSGYSVISGLAAGIDTAAHQAALECGGRTVAVVGTGLEQAYPRHNADLHRDIVASGGLVLSQFAPGTPIKRHSFPMRNATMSAYALGTIVVSAGEKSGTRHQVQAALKHGRPVVLCPQVVESTTWGQALAADPLASVSVAHTPDDVIGCLNTALTLPSDYFPDVQLALI